MLVLLVTASRWGATRWVDVLRSRDRVLSTAGSTVALVTLSSHPARSNAAAVRGTRGCTWTTSPSVRARSLRRGVRDRDRQAPPGRPSPPAEPASTADNDQPRYLEPERPARPTC